MNFIKVSAMMQHVDQQTTLHNLGLYYLEGFCGARNELLTLHKWLCSPDASPAIAISGEQGNGKSTIATAAAWNHFHRFSDGILRVSAAGDTPFRLYDVVRTFDTVLGTTLTRVSEDRWGISILEQLYRRKRLLILDKLAGGTEAEVDALVNIIGHLHEAGGQSRIVLIDRYFTPRIASLVGDQYLHMDGLARADLADFVRNRSPQGVAAEALDHLDDLYALTRGRPLPMRLILGLLLDYRWEELRDLLRETVQDDGIVDIHELVAFAVESLAMVQSQVGPLLNRLVSAAGGASFTALRQLFWTNLGPAEELDQVLEGLWSHALLEKDIYRQRVVLHPVVRRYLAQNVIMLGEEWDRAHACYYVSLAQRYEHSPQSDWAQIDVEWGNIYKGMDWCSGRVQRLWQRDPMEIIADPTVNDNPPDLADETPTAREDLRLARTYALAIAYYAFWRHPLGVLRWLSSGALAALALRDCASYAWLLTNIGRQLFFQNQVDDAVQWLTRACAILDQRDRMTALAYVHTDLGTSHRILDKPREALAHFHAAFDCVAQTGDLDGLTTAYLNLGSAYYSLEDYDRALSEHRKALRVALRHFDDHSAGSAFNNMGLALEGAENFDEARQAYLRALEIFRRIDDQTGVSTCYNNLGSACYACGDFDQSLMWYELDLALSEARGNWTDMAATLHNLGHVSLEQESYEQAQAYFERSRDLYAAFELTDYVAEEEEMIEYIQSLK